MSFIESDTSHSAWMSVIVLDLPAGLPVGRGKVHISSDAVYNSGTHINEIPIDLEIIAGSEAPNRFRYMSGFGASVGDLSYIEPMQQAIIRTPQGVDGDAFNGQIYGAAEIKLDMPMRHDNGGTVADMNIRIVQDDMYIKNTRSQTNMNWSRSDDELTVYFSSPLGMSYYEPRFSVIANTYTGNNIISSPPPNIISVKYFDLDGNVAAIAPSIRDFTITLE